MATNVQQLLLQVDASVELARRNIASLATSVVNDTGKMQTALDRVDAMFDNFGRGMKAGAAQSSAEVFVQGFQKAEAAAQRLLASIDPLYAAEQRYISKLEEANNLHKIGAMSGMHLADIHAGLKRQYDEEVASLGRASAATEQLTREENELSAAAERLKSRLDPLYAAQQRHAAAINEAEKLLQAGKISWTTYGQAVDQAAHELQAFRAAQAGVNDQMNTVNRTSGQMRLGMQNLSFQINDMATMFALGARPQQIFASQAGQVVAALQMMGHESNKFVRFLGGPWGIALSLAVSGLALFGIKNKEAEESVAGLIKKMEKQEAQAYKQDVANKVWEDSIRGVIKAQRDLGEELDKELRTPAGENREAVTQAEADLRTQQSERQLLEKEITRLKKAIVAAQAEFMRLSSGPRPELAGVAQAKLAKLKEELKNTTSLLGDVDRSIVRTEDNIRKSRARVVREEAKASFDVSGFYDSVRKSASQAATYSREVADAIEAVASASDGAAEKAPGAVGSAAPKVAELVQSLRAGKTSAAQFAAAMNAVAKSIEAAGKAAKDNKKSTQLPKVTQGEAVDLIKEVFGSGTDITSTTRTPKQNKDVGGAANSYHLQNGRALAIDFIPQGGMKAFNKEMLRLAAQARGFDVLELLGPGDRGHDDHGHLAVALKRLGPDQVAKAQASLAAKQNSRELGQMRFTNGANERLEELNGQLIAAQMELVDNTEQQAEFSALMVRSQHAKIQKDIENDAAEAKKAGMDAAIVDAKTAELKEANEKVLNQKLANIEVRKQIELAREANALERQRSEFAQDGLRFEDEMANSRKEHLRIQLEIVDAIYAQRERDLEYAKLQAERNGNLAEANRIQEEINNLPTERSRDRARTERQNESPFDAWRRDAADTTDEIENLKVQGLEGLVDTLVAAKDGWEAMRKVALSVIQDILTQLIRMQTMKLLANLFGTVAGAAAGGGGGTPLFTSSNPGVGFADGGKVKGPGTGTSDSIPAWLSNGEYVVNAAATRKYLPMLERINSGRALKLARGGLAGVSIPKAANINVPSGGGDSYNIHVNVRGPIPPAERRRTGAQVASGLQAEIARTKRKGM
jgi:hypothetical protein